MPRTRERAARSWGMVLGLFLAATTPGFALGGEDAHAAAMKWLAQMHDAVSGLSYQGQVAYVKDKEVDSFQIYHSVEGGQQRERLVSLNAPLREVVREADRVICYFPENRSAFVDNKPAQKSSLMDLPGDIGQLGKYYRFGLHGQEFVAQRQAQVVSLEPRDGYRYARLLWIDTETKLPVKFEMLDEDGQVVEQMVFTSLKVEPVIRAADLEASVRPDQHSWQFREKETLPLESLAWSLKDVPPGFKIVAYTRMKRPPADHWVDHILLSDGLSSVSVYIEAEKGARNREYPRKTGAVNARVTEIDGHPVTVMGEVPTKTIEAISEGISHQPEPPR